MNILDEMLAKLPLTEVTIRTSIPAARVLDRVDYGLRPSFRPKWQRSGYFAFVGAMQDNHIKIQGHCLDSEGKDEFPPGGYIAVAFIAIPLGIETSPTFYGRVVDEGTGSVIRGHFAIPFPILSLLVVILLLLAGRLFPGVQDATILFSLFLVVWSTLSLFEFITERKGIPDFLQGMFSDVIAK